MSQHFWAIWWGIVIAALLIVIAAIWAVIKFFPGNLEFLLALAKGKRQAGKDDKDRISKN